MGVVKTFLLDSRAREVATDNNCKWRTAAVLDCANYGGASVCNVFLNKKCSYFYFLFSESLKFLNPLCKFFQYKMSAMNLISDFSNILVPDRIVNIFIASENPLRK